MELKNFPRPWKAVLPFVVLVAALLLSMPRKGEFQYKYRRGGKWNYETLVAPFSFPILKTQEQLRQEQDRKGSTYIPYYKYDDAVSREVALRLEKALPRSARDSSSAGLVEALQKCYERGVLPDTEPSLNVNASASADVVFVQKGKRAEKMPRTEVYTADDVRNMMAGILRDSTINLQALIDPNLIFDAQTSLAVFQESAEQISPTLGTFKSGNTIVSSGELITSDIEQILDSYKSEFQNNIGYNGPGWMLWLGNFLISLILAALLYGLVWFIAPEILDRRGECWFILTVFFLSAAVTFVISKFDPQIALMVPYPVFALYFMAFFRNRLVLPLYSFCLVPLLVFSPEGGMLFLMHLAAGYVAVYSFSFFNKGFRQFICAGFIFLTLTFVFLAFKLFSGELLLLDFRHLGLLALASLFCVLTYPLVYLFELIFRLVSVSRLVDLVDTNNPLVRLLSDKAPGTFQHSLSVMNMADAAARSIGANVPLIRAAALYHDVGKIMNPLCFVENQGASENYHADLSYKDSAEQIIRHVTDGDTLAQKYGIPDVVRSFIRTHHGTTSTGYFYNKFLNEGGDPADAAAFFYPGPRPSTREQVILMFCDTLEAASRTLEKYDKDTVSALVEKIYSSKYHENQFDDVDITIHELDVVKETLKDYIVQMHHQRIVYPTRKKSKTNKK